MPRIPLGVLATLILAAAVALPAARGLAQPTGVHGIDPADMDFGVSPRSDFYRFANGGWLDRSTIPPDKGRYGVFDELTDRTTRQLLALLARLGGSDDLAPGTDEWKALQLYEQGTDLAARNVRGLAPIRATLEEIEAIADLAGLHHFLEGATFKQIAGILPVDIQPDLKDSRVYAVYLGGPFLGLPNRDYYLDDADEQVTGAYIATAAKLLVRAGHDPAEAEADARAVHDLERRLAERTLSREEQQTISVIYNPASLADLAQAYPLMDWPAYLRTLGIAGSPTVIVTEPGYLRALDGILRATPLEPVNDYLALELLWSTASLLDEETERTAFEFSGPVLRGVEEQLPLDERVLDQVNASLGQALGRLYVAEVFPPEAKAQIEDLVRQVILAFGWRLEANTWMSPETKVEAREKLARLGVKVGYPDRWHSYAAVEVGRSYAETAINAAAAEQRRRYALAGRPVDRAEWDPPPQVINAFYDPVANEIVFPAGILQPPFFDYLADPASNYGAVGLIIGHEITHGFDLIGSQFDADGNLRDWWQPEDHERFDALSRRVVAQYGAIELLPGLRISGQITVTENVADLGGVQVAYDALRAALGPAKSGTPPPATPMFASLTQEQRFFIAAATVWRAKVRDEFLATLLRIDEHSPASVRGVQPVRNMDAFFAAFGIVPGDPMYLPPEERVVIW